MADKRTASVVTWINSARRARMSVEAIFGQAQVRQWYARKQKVRCFLTAKNNSYSAYTTISH
jgi:hypothetical protein